MFIVVEAKRFPSLEHFRTHCRKSHKQQRLSYQADHHDDSESRQMSEYAIESRPTSIHSLTEATASSSAPTSSANSSVSNVSKEPITLANSLNNAKALFRKKSLVQLINDYIKAGIVEGAFFNEISQSVYMMVKINVQRNRSKILDSFSYSNIKKLLQ